MGLFKSKEEKAFIKIQKKAKLIDDMQMQIDKEKEEIDTMGKLILEGGKLKRKDDGIPVQPQQQPQYPQSPMRQPVVQTMNDTVDIVIPRQQPMAELQPSEEQIMAYHQQQAMQQQALRQAAIDQNQVVAQLDAQIREQHMRQQMQQQAQQMPPQANVTVKLFETEPWQLSVLPAQMQDFLTQVANAINTKSTIQLGKHLVNGAAIEFVEYD